MPSHQGRASAATPSDLIHHVLPDVPELSSGGGRHRRRVAAATRPQEGLLADTQSARAGPAWRMGRLSLWKILDVQKFPVFGQCCSRPGPGWNRRRGRWQSGENKAGYLLESLQLLLHASSQARAHEAHRVGDICRQSRLLGHELGQAGGELDGRLDGVERCRQRLAGVVSLESV